METPIIIRSTPGIKRDGTDFEGDNYKDGLWVRFQRGLPRKIGGYHGVTSSLDEITRGMSSFTANNTQYMHLGSATQLTQVLVNSTGSFAGAHNRTPAGFAGDANTLWQFDTMFDTVGGVPVLIAHAPPNLMDISSTTETPIYVGDMTAVTALTDTGVPSESGGIVVLSPYVLKFGNNGHVAISAANDPSTFPKEAWITGQKIVRGMPLRGGGQGPSGLLWSLDSLLRATFVGDTPVFAFDTISSETSILSSQSVIEYDGIYFWTGVDRFLMFNGVVREVPNNMNINFFYDNLNYAQRQKVFAYKVPRFGEIWWCFPFGDATECTHAVIFNVREGIWYDTLLPGGGRSAGVYAKVYSKPFMADVTPTNTGYTLWQHETGVDQVSGSTTEPIPAFIETADFSMLTNQTPASKSLRCARIEPDFVQSQTMTVEINGRANARAPLQNGPILTFPEVATDAAEQIVDLKESRRLMRFRFGTNIAGGDFQMGQCIAHIEQSEGRVTQ